MRPISHLPRPPLLAVLLGLLAMLPAAAAQPSSLDEVLERIIDREQRLAALMEQYQPLVETYFQSARLDPDVGTVPVKDRYFLGRLSLSQREASPAAPARKVKKPKARRPKDSMLSLVADFYASAFEGDGFAQMLILDRDAFDREHYDFAFVRREFLGEIRTLVFELMPKKPSARGTTAGRFTGRIWVEDRDFHIVRYNGVYDSILGNGTHFDSWRLNMAPGLWLPAYVYTEDADWTAQRDQFKHKSQTRVWGYDVKRGLSGEEFTNIMVDAAKAEDHTESPGQISPVGSLRAWEREAEDNVLRRLEAAGLLAPEGEVTEVLGTVVANLEVTNELDIQPPVRCRVLLTTPLESFTIGHTIVLSRGLVDVLPDEASLAMVLAHELGHILSGHRLDTRYAFSDQVLVGDRAAMEQFRFQRDPEEELEADERAVALLDKSPYAGKLDNAGLFLKELAASSAALPSLIQPHFGSRMANKSRLYRMAGIVEKAPEIDRSALDQITALPLGGRVKVDPWSASIELMKNNRVALLSAREKMPFQITPLRPHLVRYGAAREPIVEHAAQEPEDEPETTAEPWPPEPPPPPPPTAQAVLQAPPATGIDEPE